MPRKVDTSLVRGETGHEERAQLAIRFIRAWDGERAGIPDFVAMLPEASPEKRKAAEARWCDDVVYSAGHLREYLREFNEAERTLQFDNYTELLLKRRDSIYQRLEIKREELTAAEGVGKQASVTIARKYKSALEKLVNDVEGKALIYTVVTLQKSLIAYLRFRGESFFDEADKLSQQKEDALLDAMLGQVLSGQEELGISSRSFLSAFLRFDTKRGTKLSTYAGQPISESSRERKRRSVKTVSVFDSDGNAICEPQNYRESETEEKSRRLLHGEHVAQLMQVLRKNEQTIIKLRYGLDESGMPHTFGEIAEITGLNLSNVTSFYNRALRKLQAAAGLEPDGAPFPNLVDGAVSLTASSAQESKAAYIDHF